MNKYIYNILNCNVIMYPKTLTSEEYQKYNNYLDDDIIQHEIKPDGNIVSFVIGLELDSPFSDEFESILMESLAKLKKNELDNCYTYITNENELIIYIKKKKTISYCTFSNVKSYKLNLANNLKQIIKDIFIKYDKLTDKNIKEITNELVKKLQTFKFLKHLEKNPNKDEYYKILSNQIKNIMTSDRFKNIILKNDEKLDKLIKEINEVNISKLSNASLIYEFIKDCTFYKLNNFNKLKSLGLENIKTSFMIGKLTSLEMVEDKSPIYLYENEKKITYIINRYYYEVSNFKM